MKGVEVHGFRALGFLEIEAKWQEGDLWRCWAMLHLTVDGVGGAGHVPPVTVDGDHMVTACS